MCIRDRDCSQDSSSDAAAAAEDAECHVCMPVFSLYTPRGEKIHEPSQLVNGEVYVAVGSEHGGQFQHRHYGGTKFQLDRRGRKRYPFQWRKLSERYGWQQFTRGRLFESYL